MSLFKKRRVTRMGSWKVVLFLCTFCITILLFSKFELDRLKSKVSLIESNLEEIIHELKTKDESIAKLENIISEILVMVAPLQNNIHAIHAAENKNGGVVVSAVRKAEDMVSEMLEKSFALSKDALKKAKAFDKQKIGFREKMIVGTTIFNEKVKKMDQMFQVSEKTKLAIVSAGETIVSAGSTSVSWVTGAFDRAAENKYYEGAIVSAVQKAEDIVSGMLEKGSTFSKDALNKAKAFDKQKIGLSEKMIAGTTIVNEKVKKMDQRFQVIEKTKSAILSTKETIGSISSVIKKNEYVSKGTLWFSGTFDRVVAQSAEYLGQKSKENYVNDEKEGEDQESL